MIPLPEPIIFLLFLLGCFHGGRHLGQFAGWLWDKWGDRKENFHLGRYLTSFVSWLRENMASRKEKNK